MSLRAGIHRERGHEIPCGITWEDRNLEACHPVPAGRSVCGGIPAALRVLKRSVVAQAIGGKLELEKVFETGEEVSYRNWALKGKIVVRET